jgi:hypothetical protein
MLDIITALPCRSACHSSYCACKGLSRSCFCLLLCAAICCSNHDQSQLLHSSVTCRVSTLLHTVAHSSDQKLFGQCCSSDSLQQQLSLSGSSSAATISTCRLPLVVDTTHTSRMQAARYAQIWPCGTALYSSKQHYMLCAGSCTYRCVQLQLQSRSQGVQLPYKYNSLNFISSEQLLHCYTPVH